MMHNISSAQTDADNFYRSDAVTAEKVSFPNQYKMKVGANLFRPKEMKPGEKRPAIIVGHPMGAVKEPLCDQNGRTRIRPARHRPVILG